MIDCQVIKQGAMFYVPDMSGDTEAIFTGEHYPKKCRPWIVVSNDVANGHNARINVVPVYSRNRLSIPTDVYFSNGDRDCVACCNQVMSIEADKIDTRGYVGTVSTEILNQIKKALCIQFGIDKPEESKTVNDTPTINIEELTNDIKTNILNNLNVENIVSQELVKLLFKGHINVNTNISLSDIKPANINNETINNVINNNNNNEIIDNTNITNTPTAKRGRPKKDVSNEIAKKRKKCLNRRPTGKIMTIEQCKEFCNDVSYMTDDELVSKWEDYGLKNATKDVIAKKKFAIKYRLTKEGILV